MNKFPLFLLISLYFLTPTESYAIDNEKIPLLLEKGLRHRNIAIAKQEAQPGEDRVEVVNNKATVTVTYQSPLDLLLDEFLKKQEDQKKRRYIKTDIIKDYYPIRKNERKFVSGIMYDFHIKREEVRPLYEVFRDDEHYAKQFGRRR